MTNQEAFDTMVRHLAGMTKRSIVDSDAGVPICLYRGPDGAMCAVGCLIPDDEYDPSMERKAVYSLDASEMLPPALLGLDVDMLVDMQAIHDRGRHWDDGGLTRSAYRAMRGVAADFGLSDAVVDEVLAK